MNTTFKKCTIALLSIVAVLYTSCEDADDNGNIIDPNNSAYDLTETNSEFSILNTALIRTGLDATLDSQGTYTVFAPNNAAFNQYFTENGFANIEAVPIADLRAILLYHVLNIEVTSELLNTGYIKTLGKDEEVEALDLFIEATTSVVLNGSVTVTQADIEVDNGVVHMIDKVLDLPTVITLVAANPEFSNLETALLQQGLEITLSNTDASMQDPFTVFAPTDDGFQDLVDLDPMDGLTSLQDILDLTNLTDILLYHVVGNDRIRSGNISNGVVIDPITTGTFSINTTSGILITDEQMTEANITATDITAVNGVIHKIDIVIRPL
ncbi:fasciclin domain-containing protein [Nonlabens sp. Ci31]|uniref:fasciclin domain-containing protein n=1 Tax=Nonlabens sp. Ci31 TaxID=2608253 RepID=UPI001464A2D6|nr:fasciclin domain-containing protein [Nonlabens sp. Ci31]QJP32954.1 fasciclin domain-containing protein [Nonlabens sp. Ci31]